MKIYDELDFSRLPGEAHALFEVCGRDSFFNLAGWFRLATECGFGDACRTGLAVDEENLVALPFRRVPQGRNLKSCTSMYSCEFDVLSDQASASTMREFARSFVSAIRPLDSLFIEGMDPTRFNFTALIDGFRASGFVAKPYFGWGTWYESTSGLDFDRYLAARPSILRNTWKRKHAALAKSSNIAFRSYRGAGDLDPNIVTYERIREQSWKAAEPLPAFIPALIKFAAGNGALRLGILDIDGEPAAAQFWIVWAGRATIYKLVYAEKFAAFSPGTLLTMHMMEMILEQDRPVEIDFGRGDDAYKQMWLSSRRERWGIEAGNPRTWRGFAHATRLRAALVRDRMKSGAPRSGTQGRSEVGRVSLVIPYCVADAFKEAHLPI
ncbi:MAG TPA: GNAT family N-acetyltransferase [Rhizomicrobium sp.]